MPQRPSASAGRSSADSASRKALGWLFGGSAGAGEAAAAGGGLLSLPVLATTLGALGIEGGVEDAITGKRDSYLGKASTAVSNWILGDSGKKGNKARISELLLKGGLSRDNVNGILANLQTESGFDPTEDPRKHGRTENAYGLAQWHAPRQADFKRVFGHDIRESTLDEQVQFLLWELKNTHKKAGDALSGADAAQSGAAFSELFESPANGLAQARQRASWPPGSPTRR